MGATDSKLQFKRHVLRLCETDNIPRDDNYWNKFWQQPESTADVFTLLTASDIRRTRNEHPENLEILISVVCERFLTLARHHKFPSEVAPAKELLNCVRILTRVLPFLYERTDNYMAGWESRFFWGSGTGVHTGAEPLSSSSSSCLAAEIVDASLELLFRPMFTVASPGSMSRPIWETGVGCTTPLTTTREMQNNRVEMLRFLLALSSECLYKHPSQAVSQGSPWLGYIVTHPNKHMTMAVLCSLLNTTLKYSPGWKVPYDHMLLADRNRQLVVYSLHLLLALLIYVEPANNSNRYRHYFSKIHRPQDLQFIADMTTKLLSQPIQASASYLPGALREIQWILELVMLMWELLQCNNRFRTYVLESCHAHDFVVLLLYYIHEKRTLTSQTNLVRVCGYVILYLSGHVMFARSLSKRFEGQRYLPASIKLVSFDGTYADYLVIQLVNTILALQYPAEDHGLLVPTLLGVLYNVSGYVTGLSYTASTALVNCMFASASLSATAGANRRPAMYVTTTLIKCINLLVRCNFRSNRNLVFVLLKDKTKLKTMLINDSKDIPSAPDGSSSSAASADSASASLSPLLTPLLDLIGAVNEAVPYSKYFSDSPGAASTTPELSKLEPHVVIEAIGNIPSLSPYINLDPHDPTLEEDHFEPLSFAWDNLSLGWYISVLWGTIYQADCQSVVAAVLSDVVSGPQPTVASVWNGTSVLLFKVQETAPTAPSLLQPQGAVDALADVMVQKLRIHRTG